MHVHAAWNIFADKAVKLIKTQIAPPQIASANSTANINAYYRRDYRIGDRRRKSDDRAFAYMHIRHDADFRSGKRRVIQILPYLVLARRFERLCKDYRRRLSAFYCYFRHFSLHYLRE
jgi:hypothetical protein